MSEYIIEIPDEYFASYDTERDMYYPDERDSAMPITPFVRCRDCKHVGHIPDFQPDKRFKPRDYWWCEAEWCEGLEGDNPTVEPDGYCWHGERRDS